MSGLARQLRQQARLMAATALVSVAAHGPYRWQVRAAQAQLEAIPLCPGDIVIDCGANVGTVTARFAARGARVYAFEPNPYAFAVLADRFRDHPNVECIQKAVLDENGTAFLYRHQQAEEDPLYWSIGSSLVATKSNVTTEAPVPVVTVDLAEFIAGLGGRVRLMKMDVEGVEFRILRRLIVTGLIHRIDYVFVETHERKIPALHEEATSLRALMRAEGVRNINLGWV